MLDCRRDHLDYGEMLKPPHGYILEKAIASTYSLDLNALLSVPVALVFAQSLEGELTTTRFQILEGIRQLSRIVKVYHQKGQVHIPAEFNWLYSYLEDVLVPILPDQAFSSFHPKVWILKYTSKTNGKPKFRVIILSRNLTFDRSWDVAVFLEGEIEAKPVKDTLPLVDFARWLDRKESFEGSEAFLDELSRTRFLTPGGYSSHTFHCFGIDGYSENPTFNFQSNKAIIISPFLDENALRQIIANVAEKGISVYSNSEDFDPISTAVLNQIEPYCLSEFIRDGESIVSEDDPSMGIQQQDLHAKVYLFESNEQASLLLGSANLSLAAKERNTEFLLELTGPASFNKLHKELIGEEVNDGPFVKYDLNERAEDNEPPVASHQNLRILEYQILISKIMGLLHSREDNQNYNLEIEIDLSKIHHIEGVSILVHPLKKLTNPQYVFLGQNNTLLFENFDILSISRFLAIKIELDGETYHKFLICIDLEGLPLDRLDNIFKAIIKNSDNFFEYLRFLLADDISKDDILKEFESHPENAKNHGDANLWFQELPIFENLLAAASRNPQKLREVDNVIKRLDFEYEGKPIIPQQFRSFWEKFKNATLKGELE